MPGLKNVDGTRDNDKRGLEIHIGVYRPGVESKHPLKNAISQKVTPFFGRFFRQVADML